MFVRARGVEAVVAEAHVRRTILTLYVDGWRPRRHWNELRRLVARPERLESLEDVTDQRVDVQAALMSLPAQQRAVVVLRFYDDLTVREIADRLGLAEGTVKRYLSVAVHRMEGLLGPLPRVEPTETLIVEGDHR